MTVNEKLARWQGWKHVTLIGHKYPSWISTPPEETMELTACPDYLNDDAAAMSLLDTLVKKGYVWFLGVATDELGEIADIRCKVRHKDSTAYINEYGNTRRAAVVAACLELIGKEDV